MGVWEGKEWEGLEEERGKRDGGREDTPTLYGICIF